MQNILHELNIESSQGIRFVLPLHTYNTIICGESGEGKTFLYNTLKEYQQNNRNIGTPFMLINPLEDLENCKSVKRLDTLYVVDNADIACDVCSMLKEKIDQRKYQFLLMGHDMRQFSTALPFWGTLQKEGNVIKFVSKYKVTI